MEKIVNEEATHKKYENINHFLTDNPGWISVNAQLPPEHTEVYGLCWMFYNFSIEKVYHSLDGYFTIHTPHGWWSEKVSHWKNIT